jgi:hypothetical protein
MTTLSMAHDQWHHMNGKYSTCDLDCGAGERVAEFFEIDAERVVDMDGPGIRCGSCKGRHANPAAVKFCYEVKYDSETAERNEAAMVTAIATEGECEHGLSQALCSGPGHYPVD